MPSSEDILTGLGEIARNWTYLAIFWHLYFGILAVAGLTLMLGGFGSKSWTAVVGILSLFYGFYGAAILGVSIDWVLLVGALFVLALPVRKMESFQV